MKGLYLLSLAVAILALPQSAAADTYLVVVNKSSQPVDVRCNALGRLQEGEGTWSCLDATITADDGRSWLVRDPHEQCDGGWYIDYVDRDTNEVFHRECTPIPFGRTGCNFVEVRDDSLQMDVATDALCAQVWTDRIFGPAAATIWNEIKKLAPEVIQAVGKNK